MFTLQQLKDAHGKVKSGADFPNYIKELKQLGITKYKTHVSYGHTQFEGENDFRIQTDPRYPVKVISDKTNKDQFVLDLKAHQKGKTDYPSFCDSCAQYGISNWVVDTSKMTCTYYDALGNEVLREIIPS